MSRTYSLDGLNQKGKHVWTLVYFYAFSCPYGQEHAFLGSVLYFSQTSYFTYVFANIRWGQVGSFRRMPLRTSEMVVSPDIL